MKHGKQYELCVSLAGFVMDLTVLSSNHKPPVMSKAWEPFQDNK